jgi:hypothetical protein
MDGSVAARAGAGAGSGVASGIGVDSASMGSSASTRKVFSATVELGSRRSASSRYASPAARSLVKRVSQRPTHADSAARCRGSVVSGRRARSSVTRSEPLPRCSASRSSACPDRSLTKSSVKAACQTATALSRSPSCDS